MHACMQLGYICACALCINDANLAISIAYHVYTNTVAEYAHMHVVHVRVSVPTMGQH